MHALVGVNDTYLFVFGRDPVLSLAELYTAKNALRANWTITPVGKDACLVKGDLNAAQLQTRLSGTVKIAAMDATLQTLSDAALETALGPMLDRLDAPTLYYTISALGSATPRDIETLHAFLAAGLKQRGLKAMYKPVKRYGKPNTHTATPSDLQRHGLLEEGFEICISRTADTYGLGRTLTVSDTRALRTADQKRHKQNPVSATSLRLAGLLVNLAGLSEGGTLLDPFCGVGSILVEARQKGLGAIGIDSDPAAIKACRQNLAHSKNGPPAQLHQGEATGLVTRVGGFDAVVTEPDLGMYFKRLPSDTTATAELRRLEELFDRLFENLARTLRVGGHVVIVLPQYRTIQGKTLRLPDAVFLRHGFRVLQPIPGTKAFPYLYRTPANKIDRFIYVLAKEKPE
jgi:tRNA G10  N-methylase Trm11